MIPQGETHAKQAEPVTRRSIAFFDFDGTLTHADTMIDFLIYMAGLARFFLGVLSVSPFLVLFKLKVLSASVAKEKLLAYFLKGMPAALFEEYGMKYARERIPLILKTNAVDRLRWHKKKGDMVIIVTASIEEWVRPWCESENVMLVATRMGRNDGVMTGHISTPNCSGEEKVRRIEELVRLQEFKDIYAYGDTKGDKEMLAISNIPGYRVF
jgi:phosphatidylglycerophosphatase C